MVKDLLFNAGDLGLNSGWGTKIPCAPGQLKPVCHSKRNSLCHNKDPAQPKKAIKLWPICLYTCRAWHSACLLLYSHQPALIICIAWMASWHLSCLFTYWITFWTSPSHPEPGATSSPAAVCSAPSSELTNCRCSLAALESIEEARAPWPFLPWNEDSHHFKRGKYQQLSQSTKVLQFICCGKKR